MIKQILHFWKLIIYPAAFIFMFSCKSDHDTNEFVKDITGQKWHVWLDKSAQWADDTLYDLTVNINTIPSNKPTGGWQNLYEKTEVKTKLPCAVEELFSNGVNSWKYHGVSWFWSTVKIPEKWAKKNILLRVEKARLRLEIYINEKLAGYDLVNGTFYVRDVSKYLEPGKENTIAFRLTNPGGRRGWQDFPNIQWGDYELPTSLDFSGIGGKVTLAAVPDIYVKNIYVKNLPPYENKKVEIVTTLVNKSEIKTSLDLNIDISDDTTKKTVYETSANINTTGSPEQIIKKVFSVEKAKLWDIDSPNLYDFTVSIGNKQIKHRKTVTSGFRVITAKEVDNKQNFYLNGERLRIRSATDWGYYALTGMYPTESMANKSVMAAKKIGHNAISFHRRIGEPLVLQKADKFGLYLFGEPGGFHIGGRWGKEALINDSTITAKLMLEKCRRMVIRDRNHPSLLFYILSNEDNAWNSLRERAMKMMANLDNSRFIFNTSGSNVGGYPFMPIPHIRPYEDKIRTDFIDQHTVKSKGRFQENEFYSHSNKIDSSLFLYGEVRCYTGPDNAYEIVQSDDHPNRVGYDLNIYKPMHDKIEYFYHKYDFPETGSKVITSPEMLTKQAGRGLMYTNGRLGQIIMSNNSQDGYAINGWSGGPQLPDEWSSAITDEGRNLKGVADDFSYWIRELQIAVFRQNGKYFNPGDSVVMDIDLINENKLKAGDYTLKIKIKDGSGEYTGFTKDIPVRVKGGDTYAQPIAKHFKFVPKKNWHAGYITVEAKLYKDTKQVAYGKEQVLLQNRSSYSYKFNSVNGAVNKWPAAKKAIKDAGGKIEEFSKSDQKLDYILAGKPANDKTFKDMLKQVNEHGSKLIIKFDSSWVTKMLSHKILKRSVNEWGGEQGQARINWKNNGWGYIDHYVGNQPIPSGSVISTNSWEVPSDPYGFYPFESEYDLKVYGTYFARLDTILVLLGKINYGKGSILLCPTYPVDQNNPFSDLLFYNLVLEGY